MDTTKLNTAQVVKEYYEHDDFKANYSFQLSETFSYDEDVIVDRIGTIINITNYEFNQVYNLKRKTDREEDQAIYDFIAENLEDFTTEFYGYHVGYTSIQSISFGEQYEHLDSFEEDREELKKQFEQEGYVIHEGGAYYNLDGGLHIDLLYGDLKPILKELNLLEE